MTAPLFKERPRRQCGQRHAKIAPVTSPKTTPSNTDAAIVRAYAPNHSALGTNENEYPSTPAVRANPIADSFNAAAKYVATHRPESLAWGPAESLGPDLVKRLRLIKSQRGPDIIVWGSSTLTLVLFRHAFADEVVLLAYPVLLGTGKRFFSDAADPRELALVSTKSGASGVLINTCRPVGPLRTGSFSTPPAN